MMSSNPHKLHRKRPADSGDIDPNEGDRTSDHDKPEDFKIKTLDEILQEKRRRIEEDDEPGEERNGSSEGNSRGVSPATSARRESRTSSKQGSPVQGAGSEIIYQLSPEQMSLSPSEYILILYIMLIFDYVWFFESRLNNESVGIIL